MVSWFWYAVVAAVLYGASNFYPACIGAHRVRLGQICGRGDGSFVDFALVGVSLFPRSLESEIERYRCLLLSPNRDLCRCGNNRFLPALSAWRATFSPSCDTGRWRGNHGDCRTRFLPRSRHLATIAGNSIIGLFLLRR